MNKKIAPFVLGLSLIATSAYAASATATLTGSATSAVSTSQIATNGPIKVTGSNTGSYNMDAQAVQNLFGPDITRASFTVAPKSSISRTASVPGSTYYAKAKPSYINYREGYGWTSGKATISNN